MNIEVLMEKGDRIMTEKTKRLRFLLYIPKGREKEFELYKKIVHEMGLTVNDRIWSGLIEPDMEIVISVINVIKDKGEKKNVND